MSKTKIIDYVKAMRPHLAIFFVEVIVGALIALNFDIYSLDFMLLLFAFISFQCLYYGLYMINDVFDYKQDRLSLRKQHRPIASGRVSRKSAIVLSIILALAAFLLAFNVSMTLVYFEVFFLVYVLVYTLLLKKIPYIDTLSGGVTHTARVIMGFSLFGEFNYYFFAVFLLLLFSSFLLIKRMKEIVYKENVKRPIRYYSERKIKLFWVLVIPASLVLIYFAGSYEREIIGVLLAVYIIAIALYFKSTRVRQLFEKIAD
ncbi:MAG: UbiA family prenyltransferase [Nanoarchaeota archaeon]|nr:UbiA family prenyltransferase [Nanoarchaeota archaeon]